MFPENNKSLQGNNSTLREQLDIKFPNDNEILKLSMEKFLQFINDVLFDNNDSIQLN
jgi:hypothetical protein